MAGRVVLLPDISTSAGASRDVVPAQIRFRKHTHVSTPLDFDFFVGKWVAVDPTFGQFPADASHLRFVYGGLDRQAELLRLMGTLRIDVLTAE